MMQLHNRLTDSPSLYLRQHASNPVFWQPWDDTALNFARKNQKLLLISIGYAACHWCHVMEHECFEDAEVAERMNADFVPIKIDRESRPDLDALYMDALQLMSGKGGWPLNIIALADGRPVYGGTYFTKSQWLSVLEQISTLWLKEPQRVLDYADHLEGALLRHQSTAANTTAELPDKAFFDRAYVPLEAAFDTHFGGVTPAPKFPMPVLWRYWLKYGVLRKNQEAIDQLVFTLERMAAGGIYDQLGGGFARYSVGPYWKVPHFEKMLYDNAQLVTLYAEAYRHTKNPRFRTVITETLAWCKAELLQADGAYAAALDADSEGVEGKYYVWTEAEIAQCLTAEEMALATRWFGLADEARWEDKLLVLQLAAKPDALADAFQLSAGMLAEKLNQIRKKLLAQRQKRIAPACDHKQILGWNALLLEAFAEAYVSLQEASYLEDALHLAQKLLQFEQAGSWYRVKYEGEWSQPAFSEDLVYLAQAYFRLYQVSGMVNWLHESEKLLARLADYVDPDSGLLRFGRDNGLEWHKGKVELADNVQPSANSVYALLLYQLAALHADTKKQETALSLFFLAAPLLEKHLRFYAGWGSLGLDIAYASAVVTISGSAAKAAFGQLAAVYLPGEYLIWATEKQTYPELLSERFTAQPLRIDRCVFGSCGLPQTTVEAYLQTLT